MMIKRNTHQEDVMKAVLTSLMVPVMKLTGFRFSKQYRRAESGFKAFVYRNINTVEANLRAGL